MCIWISVTPFPSSVKALPSNLEFYPKFFRSIQIIICQRMKLRMFTFFDKIIKRHKIYLSQNKENRLRPNNFISTRLFLPQIKQKQMFPRPIMFRNIV